MSTNTEKGASAGPPQDWSPRVHRASRLQVKKKPKKVLLVDDNKVILKTTSAKLQEAGYEVLTAEDGGSAIRQARQLHPHLILLDLNFPPDVAAGGGVPWDGFLILTWLRRTTGMEKVPVIVITGEDLGKHKNKFVEAGVRDIFLKPIDHESLLAAMRWALDQESAEQDPTPTPAPSPAPKDSSDQVPEQPSTAAKATGRKKILFVDDTNDWRYLGASCLGERGYEVLTSEDPINAMLQVSRSKPDLVVLDLNLGGQSAVTVLKLLSDRFPELPILIYTAMDLTCAEISELLKQGAWNWLRKGSLEELSAAVEKTINGPKATIAQITARAAEKETAKAPPARAGNGSPATAAKTEAAPESPGIVLSLEDLRTATTEELLNAVRKARSAAFEETPVAPEPVRAAPEPPRALPEPIRVAPEPVQAVPERAIVVPELPAVLPEPPVVVPKEVGESTADSVLIVEDDASFAETLRTFLESQSFHVSIVTTGPEAVNFIGSNRVDLVLFDLTLPGFRVQQFYDAVKAAKPHLCQRIIFMTSDDSHPSDDGFVRRQKGISLWKPFPMDWLQEAMQTVRGGTLVTK